MSSKAHPAAPAPAPAAPARLEASNARCSLSLTLPPPGVCYPGQTLHPVLRFKGDTRYDKLSLRLKADSPLRVWGKDRWQAGAVASATLGGGGGVPVTNLERYLFIDEDIPLTSSGRHEVGDHKKGGSAQEASPQDGVYEFVVPYPPGRQLLPALPAVEGFTDGAQASVSWRLEFEGDRHGWYRTNDKLHLELPVVMPVRVPPDSLDVQTVKGLKYQGHDRQNLTIAARLVCDPPQHADATLHYRLTLNPTNDITRSMLDSALSASATSPVKPTASLARQVRTSPIKAENGQDFDWAATRVAGGTLEREHGGEQQGSPGELAWVGQLVVPHGHHTVQSQHLDVNYILNCHLRSSLFPSGDLHLSLPVLLPSAPAGLTAQREAELAAEAPEASGSALPPYEP
ncbi:hypothetical protein JCM8202_001596 [Rhodotorula sphaerocarpa]